MNKYNTWYAQITERARTRILDSYSEKHHIVPRCLGGSDDPDNLVKLTAREHFICHYLLVKMNTGKKRHQMLNALRIMRAENNNQERYSTKITARVYENIKEEYAQLQSKRFSGKNNPNFGKKWTEEEKEAQRQKVIGNKLTPAQHAKLVKNTTGKKKPPVSDEHRKNLSKNHKSKNPAVDCSLSEETKKKIGDKIRGRKQTQEEKDARSRANMGKKREKKLCLHCNQLIAVNTYPRFHGDNCKER